MYGAQCCYYYQSSDTVVASYKPSKQNIIAMLYSTQIQLCDGLTTFCSRWQTYADYKV